MLELEALTGDAYEAWVAGLDPDGAEPRGRLRADAAGVRFAEVVVNGPKSWSLAAELHDDVAVAYGAAQGRAAEQIIGWLGPARNHARPTPQEVVVIRPAAVQPSHRCAQRPPNPGRVSCCRAFSQYQSMTTNNAFMCHPKEGAALPILVACVPLILTSILKRWTSLDSDGLPVRPAAGAEVAGDVSGSGCS